MKISDQLEATRNAGFSRAMDPQDARRQLHVSAAIVGVLAIAATVVLSLPRLPEVASAREPVKLTVQAPQIVHVKHASSAAQPGG